MPPLPDPISWASDQGDPYSKPGRAYAVCAKGRATRGWLSVLVCLVTGHVSCFVSPPICRNAAGKSVAQLAPVQAILRRRDICDTMTAMTGQGRARPCPLTIDARPNPPDQVSNAAAVSPPAKPGLHSLCLPRLSFGGRRVSGKGRSWPPLIRNRVNRPTDRPGGLAIYQTRKNKTETH